MILLSELQHHPSRVQSYAQDACHGKLVLRSNEIEAAKIY